MNPTLQMTAYRPAVCSDRETTLQLLLRITAPVGNRRSHRPALNIGIALDRSGSMGGAPLEQAKDAASLLVRQLVPDDRVSIVAFDDVTEVSTPCLTVGSQADTILKRLSQIGARGSTALYQGWLDSCHQVQRGVEPTRLSRVLVLSDGQANVGLTEPSRIATQVADWQRQGISTSTVGLGLHYNEDLLSAMATAGSGNFYHVESPAELEAYFALELQGLCQTTGRDATLRLDCRSGVELLRVYNPLKKNSRSEWLLADLVQGHPLEVVLELRVPAQTSSVDLCRFHFEWTDLESGERRACEQGCRLPVVPFGQLDEFCLNTEVMQKRAIQIVAKALHAAVQQIDNNDTEAAKLTLRQGLETLKEAGSSPEIIENTKNLEKLLSELDGGSQTSVRKGAVSSASSISMSGFSSVVISGGFREFLALPEQERTPEKLAELTGMGSGGK